METTGDIALRIAELEWEMFTEVNEGAARAACQDDRETFTAMRVAQFSAWSIEAAESYLLDLAGALHGGRNLAAEKYIHMMETTEPSKHAKLLETIPRPDEEARAHAKAVSDKLLLQTRALFEEYPHVSGAGRPLYSVFDGSGVVSVETYQLGELLTYSKETLRALTLHIDALEASGVSLAREILENTVKFYGYVSLDAAESAMRRRAAAGVRES